MKRFLTELAGYGAASAAALAVDFLLLWAMVHFLACNFIVAATTSFLCGAVVAYQLSVSIAFTDRRLTSRRAELAVFLAIGGVGIFINAGVIYMSVEVLGLHYLFAKGVAAGFTFSFNFLARKQLLFVTRREAASL